MDINLNKIIRYYFPSKDWNIEKAEDADFPETIMTIKGKTNDISIAIELHDYEEGDAIYLSTHCGYPENKEEMSQCNEKGIVHIGRELGRCDLLEWETELVQRQWRYKSTSKILDTLNGLNENQNHLPLFLDINGDINGDKGKICYAADCEHTIRKKEKWGILVLIDGELEVI